MQCKNRPFEVLIWNKYLRRAFLDQARDASCISFTPHQHCSVVVLPLSWGANALGTAVKEWVAMRWLSSWKGKQCWAHLSFLDPVRLQNSAWHGAGVWRSGTGGGTLPSLSWAVHWLGTQLTLLPAISPSPACLFPLPSCTFTCSGSAIPIGLTCSEVLHGFLQSHPNNYIPHSHLYWHNTHRPIHICMYAHSRKFTFAHTCAHTHTPFLF